MSTDLREKLCTDVRIVMMETSCPGNIGGAARAMKNMGHAQLYLVNPKRFPHADATARAAGADDVLANAIVTDRLVDALHGCHIVFVCSARQRHLSWPRLDANQCATRVLEGVAKSQQVAIVFGNEQSGLDNMNFKYAHYHVGIPSCSTYASLNLVAAVQIIVYEIYALAGEKLCQQQSLPLPLEKEEKTASKAASSDVRLATAQELSVFYERLEKVLWDIQFLNPAHPKRLMHRLHRLFNRAMLEALEINILQGILTAIEHACRR